MSKRAKHTHHDPEAHTRHLKRQLESLEKDNHQSLNDVEGLISIALAAQEDEGNGSRWHSNQDIKGFPIGIPRKSRARSTNIYSTKANLNSLLEEAVSFY
jgi:zinc finger HIT domain-containing protein 1